MSLSSADVTFTLHARRRVRLDVAPFVVIYAICFSAYVLGSPRISAAANCATPMCALAHAVTFLSCHWWLSARCALQLRRVYKVADASLVRTHGLTGRSELCALEVRPAFSAMTGKGPMQTERVPSNEFRFEYRKRVYLYANDNLSPSPTRDDAAHFQRLSMPTGLSLSHYLASSRGLRGEALLLADYKFGPNSFAIPARTFGSLFVDHALAPFFVFQVFCVVLWSLDDYWYYSLFTLAMLVIFESTVVTSRMRNLDEMRELATPPCAALALRDGKWTPLSSEQLLPGDVIALARAEGRATYTYNGAFAEVEAACPADVVLLHGSVTVNESALTGESTPMLKIPLEAAIADSEGEGKSGAAGDAPLSFSNHKASILLGGTKILQHSAGSQPASIQPPGGGAVGYVLRTGFYSSPGELIRTILFAAERASENSNETLVFILFLLSFALAAAGYVLVHGLEDPTRSRWRLLLHCTMILTSVVPPELPMELSLAVNNSLLALHKLGIYCTEPFRIPYAGRCHICCFDKTGTLTLSELIVEGIAVASVGLTRATDEQPSLRPSSDTVQQNSSDHRQYEPSHFTMVAATQAPLAAGYVLAGCHQLVASNGKLLGDPMERAALLAAGWHYYSDGNAIRDSPLDVASLSKVMASAMPPQGNVFPTLRIVKRFPFSSELKRSSAIVDTGLALGSSRVEHNGRLAQVASECGAYGLRVVAKGSPEAVRAMLATIPDGYDATYMRYASSGKRVLALASKSIVRNKSSGTDASAMKRDEAEQGLEFCGFLVLHCPPRPESKDVLKSLSESGHTLQMLTGDSILTATHTAHALGLATKPALLLQVEEDLPGATIPVLRSSEKPGSRPAPAPVRCLVENYLSIRRQKRAAYAGLTPTASPVSSSSSGLASAQSDPCGKAAEDKRQGNGSKAKLRWAAWQPDSPALDVGGTAYPARTLPPDGYLGSDLSAHTFRELARRFDLCVSGDGFSALQREGALANALPYLRVLARMSPIQKESALSILAECGLVTMMCGDGTNDVGALKQSAVGVALVSTSLVAPPPPPAPSSGGKLSERAGTPAERQQRRLQERLANEIASTPTVKLGDASIAAAFTARSASVTSCVDVITQGRCTLVTTTQMFKILSLNCLISAYALSVLHHKGVRMSDTQATATGLCTAALFLFVSFSQPLSKLASRRPPPSALAPSVLLSVAGQFLVHLRTTIAGFQLGQSAATSAAELPPEADADFEPTMTNTVLFLLSSAMLITTFATNYTGRPYMASISSNKGLMGTLVVSALLITLMTCGQLEDLASYLELLPLPQGGQLTGRDEADQPRYETAGLRSELLSLMAADFGLCFVIEKSVSHVFRY